MTGPRRKLERAHAREHRATAPISRLRDHPAVRAIAPAAELGDQPPLVALNLLTIGAGLVLRRGELVRTGVKMLAAHGLATAAKAAIKANVDRIRPHAELKGKRRRAKPGKHDEHDYNSFPSGHTAGAVAVATAVADDHPTHAGKAHVTAALVAGAQVPRGKHYASDVAAGALIGWLSAKLTNAAIDAAERAARAALARRVTPPPPL